MRGDDLDLAAADTAGETAGGPTSAEADTADPRLGGASSKGAASGALPGDESNGADAHSEVVGPAGDGVPAGGRDLDR